MTTTTYIIIQHIVQEIHQFRILISHNEHIRRAWRGVGSVQLDGMG